MLLRNYHNNSKDNNYNNLNNKGDTINKDIYYDNIFN